LRSGEDIRSCLDSVSAVRSSVKVTPCEHPPNWIFRVAPGDRHVTLLAWDVRVPNRPAAEPAYRLNGAELRTSVLLLVVQMTGGEIRDGQGLVTADTGSLDDGTLHRRRPAARPTRCRPAGARSSRSTGPACKRAPRGSIRHVRDLHVTGVVAQAGLHPAAGWVEVERRGPEASSLQTRQWRSSLSTPVRWRARRHVMSPALSLRATEEPG
jgi:hypothetical protein